MDHQTAGKMRGMVRRVVLKNVVDTGETQTASVEVADGIWRDQVEIMQPYGVAGSVPEDGAMALALAIGGDEGDLLLMPASNPSKRMGGLKPGEVGLYDHNGNHFIISSGGIINLQAATAFRITVGGVSVVISEAGLEVTGGDVIHNGKSIGSTHTHTGVAPGSSNTGVPT